MYGSYRISPHSAPYCLLNLVDLLIRTQQPGARTWFLSGLNYLTKLLELQNPKSISDEFT